MKTVIRNEEVNVTHLDTIDWSRASFPIGVETAREMPWLALSLDEMRVLYYLLVKPLPLGRELNDGHVTIEVMEPASSVGPGLDTLTKWLKAAIAWKQSNPLK